MTFAKLVHITPDIVDGTTDPDVLFLGPDDNRKMVFLPSTDQVFILLGDGKAAELSREDMHFIGAFALACERHRVKVT